MSEEPEDEGDFIMVSDCCGVEMGEFLDVEICPACREHCSPEKQEWHPKPPPNVLCCGSCGDVLPMADRGRRYFCDPCLRILESLR